MKNAKKAADRLFALIGVRSPTDDAELFTVGVVSLFSNYPLGVLQKAVDAFHGIPGRRREKKAWESEIEFYKKICDELHAPILREEERAEAERQARRCRMLPPPPRTAEQQERIDHQVVELRDKLGIPPEGLPPKGAQIDWGDGDHVERILADLAERKASNQRRLLEIER